VTGHHLSAQQGTGQDSKPAALAQQLQVPHLRHATAQGGWMGGIRGRGQKALQGMLCSMSHPRSLQQVCQAVVCKQASCMPGRRQQRLPRHE
jgi:hypothetical protein